MNTHKEDILELANSYYDACITLMEKEFEKGDFIGLYSIPLG